MKRLCTTVSRALRNKIILAITHVKNSVLIEIILKFYGLWHDQSKNSRRLIFFLHQLSTLSLIIALAAGLTEESSTKLSIIYENVMSMTYLAGAAINYMILYTRRDQVQQLYNHCLLISQQGHGDKESEILNTYTKTGRRINRMLFVCGWPAFIVVGFLAFDATSHDESMKVIDNTSFPYYYYGKLIVNSSYFDKMVYLHVAVAYISATMCFYITKAVFVVVTTHACGIFAIASHRLQNLMVLPIAILDSQSLVLNREDRIISNLKNVIRKHTEATQIVRKIERTFSSVIGIVQIGCLVCFGFTTYEVIYNAGTLRQLLRCITLLIIYISYAYMLNWAGQEVLNVCNDVFVSSFSVEWYRMSMKTKKLLLIVQTRTCQFEKLTAASVFTLSLDNFSWVVRKSWSIATVLISTHSKTRQ